MGVDAVEVLAEGKTVMAPHRLATWQYVLQEHIRCLNVTPPSLSSSGGDPPPSSFLPALWLAPREERDSLAPAKLPAKLQNKMPADALQEWHAQEADTWHALEVRTSDEYATELGDSILNSVIYCQSIS
jgi:hypothetical protein